jgi:hypothetical protein
MFVKKFELLAITGSTKKSSKRTVSTERERERERKRERKRKREREKEKEKEREREKSLLRSGNCNLFYFRKEDVYQLGLLLLEMAVGEPSPEKVIPKKFSKEFRDFVTLCLKKYSFSISRSCFYNRTSK